MLLLLLLFYWLLRCVKSHYRKFNINNHYVTTFFVGIISVWMILLNGPAKNPYVSCGGAGLTLREHTHIKLNIVCTRDRTITCWTWIIGTLYLAFNRAAVLFAHVIIFDYSYSKQACIKKLFILKIVGTGKNEKWFFSIFCRRVFIAIVAKHCYHSQWCY